MLKKFDINLGNKIINFIKLFLNNCIFAQNKFVENMNIKKHIILKAMKIYLNIKKRDSYPENL